MKCLAILKPDAFQRRIERTLLMELAQEGPIWATLVMQMDERLCDEHYKDHREKDFYPRLKNFMLSGTVMSIVVEIEPKRLREFVREVRAVWDCQGERNLIHGSDSADSARREVELWWPGLDYEQPYVGTYSPQGDLATIPLNTNPNGAIGSIAS